MSDSDVKFERYASIDALLRKLTAGDQRRGRVRFLLEVGIFAWRKFVDTVVTTEKFTGLDVEITYLGGWLVRRYRVTVTGDARLIYAYLTQLQGLLSRQ